ncbi:peptidoglycan endopeptidase [Sandarakinorhabdus oryzae]|uniref:peptidoglycan endopeptidase n=1 Tax=Sandarakinorhabdus oryzae TaxID=2675220 RepID=UPI0012E13D9B|nr:peptidoglycan endopeptidase [Sandarakinorhabdus oryzae]
MLVARLTRRRQAAIAAARAGLGTRFHPQGRNVGIGLDCIGVALLAATGAGLQLGPVPAYALGGDHDALLADALCRLGLRRVRRVQPADLIEYALAPGHRHLALVTDRGILHAHAGLGRVVEGPAPDDWPVAACWALPGLR